MLVYQRVKSLAWLSHWPTHARTLSLPPPPNPHPPAGCWDPWPPRPSAWPEASPTCPRAWPGVPRRSVARPGRTGHGRGSAPVFCGLKTTGKPRNQHISVERFWFKGAGLSETRQNCQVFGDLAVLRVIKHICEQRLFFWCTCRVNENWKVQFGNHR